MCMDLYLLVAQCMTCLDNIPPTSFHQVCQRQDALAIAKHQGANAANPPRTAFDIKMRSEKDEGFHLVMVCLQLL